MMGAVREWLISLVTVSMLLSVVQQLLPEGSLRKVGMFIGGLVLLTVLLRPVFTVELEGLEWDWRAYHQELESRQQQLTKEHETEMAEFIEKQLAAYISDKAASLGLAVTAHIQVEKNEDGLPVPVGAVLNGELSAPLSDWIAAELGIPKEEQIWNEGEK